MGRLRRFLRNQKIPPPLGGDAAIGEKACAGEEKKVVHGVGVLFGGNAFIGE